MTARGLALLIGLAAPATARAGMPSIHLTDIAQMRIEVISFFLVALLASARVLQVLWNWLSGDFKSLPQLTYRMALVLSVAWGAAFMLVLVMISGARELMTPGAWKKQGLTYTLDGPWKAGREARILKLEGLKSALWEHAEKHGGKLPASEADGSIAAARWTLFDSEARYIYIPGATARGDRARIVAVEPAGPPPPRLALFADGRVGEVTDEQVTAGLAGK